VAARLAEVERRQQAARGPAGSSER
jgi:hypothetical protein